MTITSSFMCLSILLLFCLSFGYSLQYGDKNEKSSTVDVVSNAKVMKYIDDGAMKRVQVRGISGENQFNKETTKMMMMNSKKPTKKETSIDEEDDLVAYTADYWKPRHHPPKNN